MGWVSNSSAGTAVGYKNGVLGEEEGFARLKVLRKQGRDLMERTPEEWRGRDGKRRVRRGYDQVQSVIYRGLDSLRVKLRSVWWVKWVKERSVGNWQGRKHYIWMKSPVLRNSWGVVAAKKRINYKFIEKNRESARERWWWVDGKCWKQSFEWGCLEWVRNDHLKEEKSGTEIRSWSKGLRLYG